MRVLLLVLSCISFASASAKGDVRDCLRTAVDDVAFPEHPLYQLMKVRRWNLDLEVTPAAVTYPKSAEQVAAVVNCARKFGVKVQARSGGHSFANFGVGGSDGAIVVDLKHFQQFSMDTNNWQATIGAGTLLGDVTKKLHDAGGRAMAHGTCPAVGIGGHATIGGLGPTSRQWGSALDHVEEVQVVLANGTVTRASPTENVDLFWALKGAAAGFGIITEFKVRTEPAPGDVVQYSFAFHHGKYASMADTFKQWQRMISEPGLPRKLASQIIVTSLGMFVTGTYYGTEAEWEELAMQNSFFEKHQQNRKDVLLLNDWLGHVAHLANEAMLLLGTGQPTPLFGKSLPFKNTTLIPDQVIDQLFTYFDDAEKGSPLWFAYFDLEGGAINDVPVDATAYAHRDALFYMQSYAIGLDWGAKVSPTTKNFIRGIASTISSGMAGVDFGAYPGYVDPELDNPQRRYWGSNLERLEQVKLKYDPADIFSNPQSVRPAKVTVDHGRGRDEL